MILKFQYKIFRIDYNINYENVNENAHKHIYYNICIGNTQHLCNIFIRGVKVNFLKLSSYP